MTSSAPLSPEVVFNRMTKDGDVLLHALDAHAARQPDKLLLHYGDEDLDLSYAQFAARTRRMAAQLAAQGVGPGDHVSVLSQNALITALSMFAVWRLGAVFAPVNYNLRGGFLSYQIGDTGPKAVIADAPGVELLSAMRDDLPPLTLIGPGGDIEAYESDGPLPETPELGATDTAAIIYTSGTTGPAKGVRLGHRWINQYCYTARDLNTADDVIHCDLPLYHVGGAFNLFGRAVWTGCTTGLWDRFSATAYWDRIEKVGASVTTLLDVMIPHIMSQPEAPRDQANTLNKVHIQPYTPRHQAFARRFGVDFISVGFGQTESGSVFSAIIDEFPDGQGTPEALWRGLGKDDYRQRLDAIGRPRFDGREDLPKGIMGAPVPFFEVAALDENDMPVAEGQVGQLCLRPRFPEMILQGYLNKPEATLKVLRNCWFPHRRRDPLHRRQTQPLCLHRPHGRSISGCRGRERQFVRGGIGHAEDRGGARLRRDPDPRRSRRGGRYRRLDRTRGRCRADAGAGRGSRPHRNAPLYAPAPHPLYRGAADHPHRQDREIQAAPAHP